MKASHRCVAVWSWAQIFLHSVILPIDGTYFLVFAELRNVAEFIGITTPIVGAGLEVAAEYADSVEKY